MFEVGTHNSPVGIQNLCYRVGMRPEIIKKEEKSEKVQIILWRELKAVSFEEIHTGTEATTPSKRQEVSMESEQNRIRMKETNPEHQFVSYRHKKFGNVYHRVMEGKRKRMSIYTVLQIFKYPEYLKNNIQISKEIRPFPILPILLCMAYPRQ